MESLCTVSTGRAPWRRLVSGIPPSCGNGRRQGNLVQQRNHHRKLSASRDNNHSSESNLYRDVEALAHQVEQREAQLQASWQDQNELLHRLEQALNDLEIIQVQNQQLITQNESLRIQIQAENSQSEELTSEQIGRIAAEKALASSKEFLDITLGDLKRVMAERDQAHEEITLQHKKIAQLEEDVILASRDAKDSLHREMEALAEVENQKECISALRSENDTLRTKLIEVQSQISFSKEEKNRENTSSIDQQSDVDDEGPIDPEIVSNVATEAKKRSYEIRAEAALLVETVEDRASELVEKAQREVAILKAELKKVTGSSDDV